MSQQRQPQKGKQQTYNKGPAKGGNQATKVQGKPNQGLQNPANLQRDIRKVGSVRAVSSGDTVVLLSSDDSGLSEKEIVLTLLGLKAPLLGKKTKDAVTEDQPFAWDSREFLRKLVVGKTVVYRIEHTTQGNRSYGDLWLNEENVRSQIVEKGWAEITVKERKQAVDKDGKALPPRELRADDQNLLSLQEEAKAAKRGIWKAPHDSKAAQSTKRKVRYHDNSRRENDDAKNEALFVFFEKNKGKTLNGIVEQVRTGSTLRIYVPASQDEFTINLSGVHAPVYRANDEANSDPFSREAKFFTEHCLLNRDVLVTLESMDKTFSFYGTVLDAAQQRNIASNLVKMGLASVVEWTAPAASLKEWQALEKQASDQKLRIWKKTKPDTKGTKTAGTGSVVSGTIAAKEFIGTVVEVIGAGNIVVRVQKPDGTSVDVVTTLSSIWVPKPMKKEKPSDKEDGSDTEEAPVAKGKGKVDPKKQTKEQEKIDDAYAREAKEFLRRELIGKKVNCVLDYYSDFKSKNNNNNNNNNKSKVANKPGRPLYSVYIGKSNVAIKLLSKGYAKVIYFSEGDARSADYKEMVVAEKNAEKSKVGIYAPVSKAPVQYINDLSFESEATCRHFLGSLQRIGKINAVVEHTFSASRYKLYIPSQSLKISFALKGVLSGDKTIKDPSGQTFRQLYPIKDKAGKTIAQNFALHFARDKLFQHDVEISIDDLDRQGTFFGTLTLGKVDFALTLVESAQAKLHLNSAEKLSNFETLKRHEDRSKKDKKGVWWNYDEVAEQKRLDEIRQAREEARLERQVQADIKTKFLVTVTEIMTGSTFFYQVADDETKTFMEDLMDDFQSRGWQDRPIYIPEKRKEWVAAKFSVDGNWYRAEILRIITEKAEREYEVRYVDYGNTEILTASSIRELDEDFAQTPAQARKGKLAYIKAPGLDKEFGDDAAALLKELVWGKTLLAKLQFQEGPASDTVNHVLLGDEETQMPINGVLVVRGLANVEPKKKARTVHQQTYESLVKQEQTAKASRLCIWQYGEVADSDEDREWANMLR